MRKFIKFRGVKSSHIAQALHVCGPGPNRVRFYITNHQPDEPSSGIDVPDNSTVLKSGLSCTGPQRFAHRWDRDEGTGVTPGFIENIQLHGHVTRSGHEWAMI